MPASWRSRVRVSGFIITSLVCADGVEHRQNYVMNKNRMEQPKRRQACNDCNKAPASQSRSDPQLPARLAMLKQERQTLQNEVNRGQTIATMGRHRDDQLVQDPGDEKDQEEGSTGSESMDQGLEKIFVHEVAEGSIPTTAPESAE